MALSPLFPPTITSTKRKRPPLHPPSPATPHWLTPTPPPAPFPLVSQETVSGRWRRANHAKALSTHQCHIKASLSACFHSALSSRSCHSRRERPPRTTAQRSSPTEAPPCLPLLPPSPIVSPLLVEVSLPFTCRHHPVPLASGLVSPPPHLGCLSGSQPSWSLCFLFLHLLLTALTSSSLLISAQTVAASMQNGMWQFLGHQHFRRG